jgi:anti-sigma factor RsiW
VQNTSASNLEARLSAYLDGEVGDAERRDIDQLLADDTEARGLLERLKQGSAFGTAGFEAFLHDPVPLSLVRRIRQGTDINPKRDRVVGAPRQKRRKLWPGALAASCGMLLIGGSTGYLIGRTVDDNTPPLPVIKARTWLDDVTDAHRVYARQPRHLVEVTAENDEEIVNWLTSSTGVSFRIPDLAASGLTFQGARLLVAAGRPTAQLLFKDGDGEVYAICFQRAAPEAAATKIDDRMTESMRDDLALIFWDRPGAAYVVVGPSATANFKTLADTISDAM